MFQPISNPPWAEIDKVDDAIQLAGPAEPQGRVGCHGMRAALSPTITLRDFENGYWYLDQLKKFGERIGIPAAKRLRKDELEKAIVAFLRTGKAASATHRSLRKTGVKDVKLGLNLKLRIANYTSDRETKGFIV